MQVTETSADGLKREIQVVLPIQELNDRCEKRLEEIKDDVQIRGFRKGKVPKVHLKKVYGRRLMLEVLQDAVEQSSQQALKDRNERPVAQPEIKLPEDQSELEGVVTGSKDLSFSMKYEVIPPIDIIDLSSLEIERMVANVDEADVDTQLSELAERQTRYDADDQAEAGDGDKLKIDFTGRIDGETFEGGTAEGIDLIIGQSQFIPGFEDGLVGAKAGENRSVTTTFPEDYPVDTLKGKEAVFEVTVQEVGKPSLPDVDDELAKAFGLEDLEKLKEAIRSEISTSYARVSREKAKREILDLLDEKHVFDLPASLREAEFESIWKQLSQDLEKKGKTLEEMDKPEDELRAEYETIADRRVRLGLVLSEIGDRFEIKVEQDELRNALVQQARQYPGQEQHVYEYFEKTPGAIDQLRAPIFEEKVIDLILSKAQLTDREVSKEELLKNDDDDNDATVEAEAEASSGKTE